MADPRFFKLSSPFRLADLAEIAVAALSANSDPDMLVEDVGSLGTAGPRDVSFLDNRKYLGELETSKAGACILSPDDEGRAPAGMSLILSAAPYKSYALVAQAFYPDAAVEPLISPSAIIDKAAVIGAGCRVGPGAVIESGVEIGARCVIGANAVVGEAVRIGDDTVIGANATLSHCLIGARVHVYPGACIGQRGFGFAIDPAGHVKVPQLGRVIIEDDVEIGANTTVDRGTGPDTVIGAGAMIDNLVQVGHNVRIGARCVLAAQIGISGSCELGELVVIGGQGGLAGHLKIGAGAQIAAQSGILRDVGPGQRVMGTPAKPIRQFFREVAILEKMSVKKQ